MENNQEKQNITKQYICKHLFDFFRNGVSEEMILKCRECLIEMKVIVTKVFL